MSNLVAEQLLDEICEVDIRVKSVMDKATRDHVIKELASRFHKIVTGFPDLVEDIQRRIVKYQSQKDEDVQVTDFIYLVEWYSMCLTDKKYDKDYWNPNGKYYGLRMNEVINMFLMSRMFNNQ